jgi:cephalosporin-C deacetylase-like acetyl esterase
VLLVYSADDAGLDEIAAHAGAYAKRLRRLPGFSIRVLADSDHNITAQHAFEAYARLLEAHIGIPAPDKERVGQAFGSTYPTVKT